MAKQPRVSKAMVRNIRLKIRAVIKQNPDLQAKLDSVLQSKSPKNQQAARQQRRRAYSRLIKDNQLLSEAAKKIFDVMRTG